MILLRDPPLLFLKPHKVAGTSFEIALSAFAGPDDIVTPMGFRGRPDEAVRKALGFAGPRNYAWPLYRLPFLPKHEWRIARRQRQRPGKFRSHLSAADARDRVGLELWDRSLKLSIVRNPYDTAVSTYFWSRKDGESFTDFWRANIHLLSRNAAKYLIDGRDVIDCYLRYESIAADIETLEQRVPALTGLGRNFARLSAKSGFRPVGVTPAALFAEAPLVRQWIEQACGFEIVRFGYTME